VNRRRAMAFLCWCADTILLRLVMEMMGGRLQGLFIP